MRSRRGDARLRLMPSALVDRARESLWVVPSAGAVLALALVAGIAPLDLDPDAAVHRWLPEWLLFQGSVDQGRDLLRAMVPMTLTGAALLLALSVLLLRLVANQFSPRLLGSFMRSWPIQLTLAALAALGAYNLAQVYWMGVQAEAMPRVPRLGISIGVLLGLLAVAMLLVFLNRLAHWLQTDYIVAHIGRRTLAVLDRCPPGIGRRAGEAELPEPPNWAVPLRLPRSGYVQALRPAALLRLAAEDDVCVRLAVPLGAHVVAGATVVAWVWRSSPDARPDAEAWRGHVAGALTLGTERSPGHDVAWGLRQLVDIPSRTLYPRVRDPYTALQSVHWITTLLCRLVSQPLGAELLRDHGGTVRVGVEAFDFADLLDLGTGQLRRHAAAEPELMQALLAGLWQARALATDDGRRAALDAQIERLRATAALAITDDTDRALLDARLPESATHTMKRQAAREVAMPIRWFTLREEFRASLLALPALAIVAAVLAAAVLTRLSLPDGLPLTRLLFASSAADARDALTTIAIVVLNGTTLIFALTIVVLQVIAVEYSPRLLYNMLCDRAIHLVFAGAFLVFVYVMGVLYWMRGEGGDFPQLAVSVGLLLVFVALAGLIFMVNRLAHWMQIDYVLGRAGALTGAVVARAPVGIGGAAGTAMPPDGPPVRLPAPRSGYVQQVDTALLCATASAQNAVVQIVPRVGDYVVGGAGSIAHIRGAAGTGAASERAVAAVAAVLPAAVAIGDERILRQDAAFGMQQLLDAALRANSPIGRDPYTTIQAVHGLSLVMAVLARQPLGDEAVCDGSGTVRVIVAGRDFSDYLELACSPVRRWLLGDPRVALALIRLLRDVAAVIDDGQRRAAIGAQLQRVLAAAEAAVHDPLDLADVRAEAQAVAQALDHGA